MSRANYAWKPISLWHGEWQSTGLADVIKEFRQFMTAEAWDAFHQKSVREWSIETGQIEGAYDIDEGITVQLIEEGLVASIINEQRNGLSREQVHQILLDSKVALDGVFDFVKSNRELSVSYIRELHQQLMSTVDTYDGYFVDPETSKPVLTKLTLEKGKYKTVPNNPSRDDGSVHEYCPPQEVPAQMDEMIALYQYQQSAGTPVEVLAAWLHHAFTQIHPFQDGNGRVARVLASLILIKGGLPPFTVIRQMRGQYIRTLEQADHKKPDALIAFFESCLYRFTVKLWRELRVPEQDVVTPHSNLDEILAAAKAKFMHVRGLLPREWSESKATRDNLIQQTHNKLQEVGTKLQRAMQAVDSSIVMRVINTPTNSPAESLAATQHWGEDSIRQSDGLLDLRILSIQGPFPAEIVVCFDPMSSSRPGIWGVYAQVRKSQKSTTFFPPFFSNFHQPHTSERFTLWLDRSIAEAIYFWQEQIT